jgi:hypothetical protein
MIEFSEQYDQMGPAQRKAARKALEKEVAEQLTRIYGRVWSKGKIAVQASKMVDRSMQAGRAASN